MASESMRRTMSCPSIRLCTSTLIEHVRSNSGDAPPRVPVPCSWGDLGDSDDDEWISSLSLAESLQRPDTPKSQSTFMSDKVEEKTSAVPAAGLVQTSSGRTPLRLKASLFVPGSSRVSSMCSCAPYSLEQVSAPSSSTAPGSPPFRTTDGQITTLMMRNLPCPFLRDDLIDEMDKHGFAGCYNLVYMPKDYKTGMGLGYAFVNFTNAEQAQRFTLAFEGFCNWPKQSLKVCSITLSVTQGLIANIERLRNNPVMSEKVPERFKPMLFDGNKRIPFPKPTTLLTKFSADAAGADQGAHGADHGVVLDDASFPELPQRSAASSQGRPKKVTLAGP